MHTYMYSVNMPTFSYTGLIQIAEPLTWFPSIVHWHAEIGLTIDLDGISDVVTCPDGDLVKCLLEIEWVVADAAEDGLSRPRLPPSSLAAEAARSSQSFSSLCTILSIS